jgi:hypothetical protein
MMHSTMGAALTAAEETAIREAWANLAQAAQAVAEDTLPTGNRGEDGAAMLTLAADLVMAVSTLRTAISNGWHYANKRAYPDPDRSVIGVGLHRRPSNTISTKAALTQLGLTEADLDELLKGVTK